MSKPETFRAPKGTRDILPPESARQRELTDVFARVVERFGFGEVVSPIFEESAVFSRVGETTEIVTKEMFDLVPKGKRGTTYALRPELTASICRAFVQHNPPTPWKIYYQGPQFRYERPQAGRYRQFTQVGAEALGTMDPNLDVEVIAAAKRFFDAVGLDELRLKLNTLGDSGDRARYSDQLAEYFEANRDSLSEQSLATLEKNPLRVLDSKRQEDAAVIAEAPRILDHVGAEAANHFDAVKAGLDRLDISYEIDPSLVRGLDYYVRTTFEFVSDALEGAQNAVGGGGRYDGLVEALGGRPTPGVGFALGVDRVLLACDAEDCFRTATATTDVFVIDLTGGAEATALVDTLATAGVRAARAYDGRSAKAQFKAADKSGAILAAVVGDDELADDTVTLKSLTSGDQTRVSRDTLLNEIGKQIS